MSSHCVLPSLSHVAKFKNQDLDRIRYQCSENGVLWEDPSFLPDIHGLTWQRPWELTSSACMFQEGSVQDVRQGLLNNCHVVAAMQALTFRPEALSWVVPEDQSCCEDNSGVVHFRLWQLGTWYDVCVDDRLPTLNGELVYTHSNNEDEFWCALLEKAYAKLLGSYKALEYGNNADAMVDFSGGISECIYLDPPPPGIGNLLFKAYEKKLLMCGVINYNFRTSGVRCVEDDYNYTITGVKYLTPHMLAVRVKDPRGYREWTGPWTDPASIWRLIPDQTKIKFSLTVDHEGEFWLPDSDFRELFSTLSICHLNPDTVMNSDGSIDGSKRKWLPDSFKGAWVKGISAGGRGIATIHQNNQYRIILDNAKGDGKNGDCSTVMSLIQKNKTHQQKWTIGLKIFKLDNPSSHPTMLGRDFFTHHFDHFGSWSQMNGREVVFRQRLSPGVYCIIPCTRNKHEEGEFLLRVYTEREVVMQKSDKKVSLGGVNSIVTDMVTHRVFPVAEEWKTDEDVVKIFGELSGKDMTIDWEGLKTILDNQLADIYADLHPVSKLFNFALEQIFWIVNLIYPITSTPQDFEAGKVVFSKELCRSLISYVEKENSGRIGFHEFDSLWNQICHWKLIFRIFSKRATGQMEAAKLREALEKAGFILSNAVLCTLIQKYADEEGYLSFDDFMMCTTSLQLDFTKFETLDEKNKGEVVVTLSEWVDKSFFSR